MSQTGMEDNLYTADQFIEIFGSVIADALKKLRELQPMEIVRCKDCKHRDPEDRKCDCGHDIMWQLPREENWFCADGERKADETD